MRKLLLQSSERDSWKLRWCRLRGLTELCLCRHSFVAACVWRCMLRWLESTAANAPTANLQTAPSAPGTADNPTTASCSRFGFLSSPNKNFYRFSTMLAAKRWSHLCCRPSAADMTPPGLTSTRTGGQGSAQLSAQLYCLGIRHGPSRDSQASSIWFGISILSKQSSEHR